MKDNIKGGALTEVTLFVLLSMYVPRHGYSVMQFVEEKTRGRLVLGAGTLYGAITNLQSKGLIELYGNNEGTKKEYIITDKGKRVVEREVERLEELTKLAKEIVGR